MVEAEEETGTVEAIVTVTKLGVKDELVKATKCHNKNDLIWITLATALISPYDEPLFNA